MWKLAVVSFSSIILIGCYTDPEVNPDFVKNPNNKSSSLKANTSPKSSLTEKQTTSTIVNQVIESMQQQFKNLSQAQMQFIKETALKEASQIAKDTASQIASNATSEAIDNMQQQFADLSQAQKKAIKEITLELVNQIMESTATEVASNATNKAIENMQQQFENLSQVQTEIIKKASLELVNQIAKDTASAVASNATSEAIRNMEKEFSNLSKEQKQAIKEATLELANQIAKDTASQIASNSVNQAILNMEQQFSNLSQAQIQIIREATLEMAKDTATQIASNSVNQAILNMEQQFANLSQVQIQVIREAALEAARSTASQIASNSVNQAILNMEQQFANLSQVQIQVIREAALEATRSTASQIASNSVNQAILNMEQQFANLSQVQIPLIKGTAIKEANQTAESTASQIASNSVNQAILNMEQQFTNLSQSEMQAIKESFPEAALTTAHEAADKVIEDTVKRITLAATNHAIQGMEQQFSDLLKEGLRTIISAAIEAAIASTHESIDDDAKRNMISQVKTLAVEAAGEITLGDKNQITKYITSRFSTLPFEECHWTNESYTVRLVRDHSFFPLSDPLKNMLERWDDFQSENGKAKEGIAGCSNSPERASDLSKTPSDKPCAPEKQNNPSNMEENFAYLSPLYDKFILSFFKETIEATYLSKDDVPLECFFASSIRGANIYNPGENFYYCAQDSDRPGNMSVTDNDEVIKHILPRRACLNRDYIYLTARAFNKTAECFGFDKSEKENIFKLFNHESAFLHNIKSPTGAKCYGQLTTVNIKEINKQIYFSDTASPLPYSYIFNEVIEKCQGLQNAVLNPKFYESIEKGNKSMEKFNQIISETPISCKLTQNPYSCLFYAFYNIKKNSAEIDSQFKKDTTSFNKKHSIPQEFKDRFFLPISLNSMVGVTNTNGKDMIFWDDSEIWPVLKNYSSESLHNIRELPLFKNEKEVKDLFNLWSYNGGSSISKKYMTEFIRQLKISIASSCPLDSKTKICQYRFAVANGEGLKTEDIKRDFQIYIQKNYKVTNGNHKNRREEVTMFAANVNQSLNYLYNKDGLFKSHLKNLVPELEGREIENFQNHLENICPKP